MSRLISIIVTTYNREDALAAVLRSLAAQSDRQFEVIVADDGSGPSTAELVRIWKPEFPHRLVHVWQEDRGFRLAEVRNRAVLASQGEYCIFLDGDCIARPDFVAAHRRLAEPAWFVTGNRVLLSADLTQNVLREAQKPETWTALQWMSQRRRGGVNRLSPLLRLPLGPLRRLRPRRWHAARACNLAVWRSDLLRVDGFDASYTGWGREDSDFIVRLLHAGARRKDGIFATGVVHLWHSEADRRALANNERRLSAATAAHSMRAEKGLSALGAASSPPD